MDPRDVLEARVRPRVADPIDEPRVRGERRDVRLDLLAEDRAEARLFTSCLMYSKVGYNRRRVRLERAASSSSCAVASSVVSVCRSRRKCVRNGEEGSGKDPGSNYRVAGE